MKKGILSYALLTIGGLGVLAGISGAILAIERNVNGLKNSSTSTSSGTSSQDSSSETSSSESQPSSESQESSSSSEEPIEELSSVAIIGLTDFKCTDAEDDNEYIYMPFSLQCVGLDLAECTGYITFPEGCRVYNENYNLNLEKSGVIDPSIGNYMLVCPKPDDDGQTSFEVYFDVDYGEDTYQDYAYFTIYGKNAVPEYGLSLQFDEFEATALNGADMCELTFFLTTDLPSSLYEYDIDYNLVGYDGHIVNYCYITDEDGNVYEGPKGKLPCWGVYTLHLEKLAYNQFYIYQMQASVTCGSKTVETQAKFCANGATANITDSITSLGFAPSGTKRLVQTDSSVPNVADYYAFGREDRTTCPLTVKVLNFDGTVSNDVLMTTDDFGTSNEELTVVSGTKIHFDFPAKGFEKVDYYYLQVEYDDTYIGSDVDPTKMLVCCSGIEPTAERVDGFPEGDTIENTDGSSVTLNLTPYYRFSKYAPEDLEIGITIKNSFTTAKVQFQGKGSNTTINPIYGGKEYQVVLAGLNPGQSGTIDIYFKRRYYSDFVLKTYTYFRAAPSTLLYNEPADVFAGSGTTTKSFTFAMPSDYDSSKTKLEATMTNLKTNESKALPFSVGSTSHADGIATGLTNQSSVKFTYPTISALDVYEIHMKTYYDDVVEKDYVTYYGRKGSNYEGIFNPISEINTAVGESYTFDMYVYLNTTAQTVWIDLYDVDDKESTSFHFEGNGRTADGTRFIVGAGMSQDIIKVTVTVPAQSEACSKTLRCIMKDGTTEVFSGEYANFDIAYTCE